MVKCSGAATFSSTEGCRIARKWIGECMVKHRLCNQSIAAPEFVLPRRLIDVGGFGSIHPRLIESTSLQDKNVRYVALSHCWGDPKTLLQMVESNIQNHYEGINWDALPRTFRNAIAVCQCLQIRYLWIDSLCIIQKNKTDFDHECAQMHLIYLHCYCMIAASDARDSSEGFLRFWDATKGSTPNTEAPASNPSKRKPAFFPVSPHFRRNQGILWTEWSEALDGHLSKRGWAYQERQLAPRILHFTKCGIIWECRICIGAGDMEYLQHRLICLRLDMMESLLQSELIRILDRNIASLGLDDLMDLWLSSVEEYSGRRLSRPEDKLPALSALALTLAPAASFTVEAKSAPEYPIYLAGVWLSDLHRQLLWCPAKPAQSRNYDSLSKQPRKTVDSLPSWSWASFDGPVAFSRTDKGYYFPDALDMTFGRRDHHTPRRYPSTDTQYLSTDISLKGLNPFGTIDGGALQVHGQFIQEHTSEIKNFTFGGRDRHIMDWTGQEGSKIAVVFDDILPSFDLTLRFLDLVTIENARYGIVLIPSGLGHFKE